MTCRRARQCVAWMVVVAPLVWVCCFCAFYLWQTVPRLQQQAIEATVAWAQNEWRIPILVGEISADLQRGTITARNVLLGDPSSPRRPLLASREITVSQLFSRQPTIQVIQPVAHVVRLPDGRWNFSPLIPKRRRPPVENFWTVRITGASLHFEDRRARPTLRATLRQVNGEIQHTAGVTTFRFTHEQATPAFRAQVNGWLHNRLLRLRVDASNVPVSQLLRYVRVPALDPGDATASGTVWVYTDAQRRIHYSGATEVQATRARWRLPQGTLSLSNLSGSGEFQAGVATWQARADAGTGSVLASGTVQWQPEVALALSVDARKIPPHELRPWLRRYVPQMSLNAPVDAQVIVRGTPAQPYVQGVVHAARVAVQRVNVQDLAVKIMLNTQSALLPEVALRVAGGSVRAQAAVWKERKAWRFIARWRADGVNLARLRPYLPEDVRGNVRGEGLAYGTLQKPSVVANLWGERLVGKLWRCQQAQARIRWTPGMLYIDGAMLEDWTGSAYLSGEADLANRRLALRVRADEVLLAPWVERLAPKLRHQGDVPSAWVYARGNLEGAFDKLVFRGIVEATDVQWRRWTLDYLVARVQATAQRVTVDSGIIRRPPMEITWQGELQQPLDADRARVSADGVANNVDVREVLEALREQTEGESPSIEAVGRVFFHVAGNLRSPAVDLTLNAPAAQVQHWSLTDINGSLHYEDGLLKVTPLSARLGDGVLKVEGQRDSEGRFSLRVQGERLPLAQLRPLLPKDAPQNVDGEVSIQGVLSGDEREPVFRGELSSNDAAWDALKLNSGYAQIEWRNEELNVHNARLTGPEVEIALRSLRLTGSPPAVEAEGTLTVPSLERLSLRALDSVWLQERTPRLGEVLRELGRITGAATVPFRLWGESKSLNVQASPRVEDIEIDGRPLGTLQAQLLRDSTSVWQVRNATLANGKHRLMASGTLSEDGEINLSAEAYNVDLSWFQRWIPQATELRGEVEMATIEATGKSAAPDLTLTLALKEPQLGGIRAERVLTGKVQLSEGKIDISEITLAQPDGQLRIWGTLPFHWEPLGVPEDKPLDLHVEAVPQPLSALLAYLPTAKVTDVAGRWSLKATLSGTRATPHLSGEMRIDADRLRVAPLVTGLRDVRAVVLLSSDTVRLAEFSATGDTSRGGHITGSGTVQFGGGQQERIDASLKLERFWLDERNLSGQYGEQIRAFLNGELKITGSAESPHITGVIAASGGTFALPASFPEQRAEPRSLPINPRFENVVLRVGEGMWLNSPRLATQASGDIVLSGTLQEPVVHGQLGLERGYVYFPTARFRLEPGGTIALDYPVPGDNPFRVNVNVQANTTLSLPSPTGGVRRYGISVLVSGAITSPEGLRTEFRSDPPDLSTQQIARALGIGTIEELLTGRNVEQVLQREVVNLFTSAYIPQLFSPLERSIEEALQLREFRIEYGRYEPVTVTLVKRLWDGFSLSYWRTVSAQQDRYVLKILYELPEWTRLSRRLLLSFSVDERQQRLWGIEGSFRF
ncbi:MAG: translocation/assembly module TamB domain-containing protein [Armatimonadota bacterium]|nr:translocation/assembly module TamB domain-containing protein [bacterium]MDW8321619.1 translocation/assembly module TamB domain-containing protein [Armatimonadota bacterium]